MLQIRGIFITNFVAYEYVIIFSFSFRTGYSKDNRWIYDCIFAAGGVGIIGCDVQRPSVAR